MLGFHAIFLVLGGRRKHFWEFSFATVSVHIQFQFTIPRLADQLRSTSRSTALLRLACSIYIRRSRS